MVALIHGLRVEDVRANHEQVLARVADAARQAGRDPAEVAVLAAVKYVEAEELPALAAAGIALVGENRAQDLAVKFDAHGDLFTWDFIGQLQSRRVRQILPYVRYIHSLASESALHELARHRHLGRPELGVLIEVDVAREPGKAGVAPEQLDHFIERCPVPVVGLMTMPPLARDAEDSRRWFAALAGLARERGLRELSMGTTQDYEVAVQEGATIVRIGTRLYA